MSVIRDSWSAYEDYTGEDIGFEQYEKWVCSKFSFTEGPSGAVVMGARYFHGGFLLRAEAIKDGLSESLNLIDEAKDVIHQIRYKEKRCSHGGGFDALTDSQVDGIVCDVSGWIDMLIDDIETRTDNH